MIESARILVLGASYGLLPGIKFALSGHAVTFIGRGDEIAAMALAPLELHVPLRHDRGAMKLEVATVENAEPGRPALRTPDVIDPREFEFAILAMQEPHFAAPEVSDLMGRIAEAGIPCLSIMNLPPPCFLDRLGTVPSDAWQGVYASGGVWARMDAERFTLASPDAQAMRKDPARPGVLSVTLPSNFKAAPFARSEDQVLLERLAEDMSRLKYLHGDVPVRPPVMLLATRSLHAPLAKWPMLIAGNCRCLTPDGIRSIAEAIHGDLGESRAIYELVTALVLELGACQSDLVEFSSYARAAEQLTLPSSMARGLAAGARQVERIDRLVLNLLRHYRLETQALERICAAIDRRLANAARASA